MQPPQTTPPGRLARWCAALYPRTGPGRDDTTAFLDDAIADAHARAGWLGVVKLSGLIARDIARAWSGRSALHISAAHPSPHLPDGRSPRMERWTTDLRFATRVLRLYAGPHHRGDPHARDWHRRRHRRYTPSWTAQSCGCSRTRTWTGS